MVQRLGELGWVAGRNVVALGLRPVWAVRRIRRSYWKKHPPREEWERALREEYAAERRSEGADAILTGLLGCIPRGSDHGADLGGTDLTVGAAIFPGFGPAKQVLARADYHPRQKTSARSLRRFCTAISRHDLPCPPDTERLPPGPLCGLQLL